MRKLTIFGLIIVMLWGLLPGGSARLVPSAQIAEANAGTKWNASYYDNRNLEGSPVLTRIDDVIDFNWVDGSPGPNVPSDNFSVRWTQTVTFSVSGKWTFKVGADDGVRMWIDGSKIVDEWHETSSGFTVYTVDLNELTAGNHDLKVEYFDAVGNAGVQVIWSSAAGGTSSPMLRPSTSNITGSVGKWNAQYYNNASLAGTPLLTRVDDKIDFDWGSGVPVDGIPADNFSVRWSALINFSLGGKWTFIVGADDGVRLWIDATLLVDQWHGATSGYTLYTVDLGELTAGDHALKVEYYEATGFAGVEVAWKSESGGTSRPSGEAYTGTGGEGTLANWEGFYYDNRDLAGNPLTRTDSRVDFNWAEGSPDPAIPADFFSARWLTTVNMLGGTLHLRVGADDGIRVYFDDQLVIDKWQTTPGGFTIYEKDVPGVTAGDHRLRVDYFEYDAFAGVLVQWWFLNAGGAGGVPIASKPIYAAVTADKLFVRKGPGQGYPIIKEVFYPENYLVKGAVPDMSWIMIELPDGRWGWVSNEWVWLFSDEEDFVTKIPRVDTEILPGDDYAPLPADSEPEASMALGRTTSTLNVRDGASSQAKDIGGVPENTLIQIEARNPNGAWYLMTYNGLRGWVFAPYVELIEGTVRDLLVSSEVVPAPPGYVPDLPASRATVRGQLIKDTTLRNNASLRADNIGTVPTGTELVIEARNANGAWYLVTYDGTPGWIFAPDVTLTEGTVHDLLIR